MKKFFSLVLALVMALSLTTVAWGATGSGTTADPYVVGDTADLTAVLGTVASGSVIKLTENVTFSGQNAADKLSGYVIDLNDKTMTLSGNTYLTGETTIMNGKIVVSGAISDSYLCLYNASTKLTLDDVELTGTFDAYAVLNGAAGSTLVIKNSVIDVQGNITNPDSMGNIIYGGNVTVDNSTIKGKNTVRGIGLSNVTIQNNSTVEISDVETGLNNSTVTVNDSTVTITNATKRAVRLNNNTLTLQDGATLTATDCTEDIVGIGTTDTVSVSSDSTLNAVDGVTPVYVAEVGGTKYESLQAAIDAAEVANTVAIVIDLLGDATLDVTAWEALAIGSDVTTSITINGNNNTLTFNQLNSDWNNIATKNGAKLIINNAKITNSGHNDGPWNRHDLNFACDVELNDVTSDKALAFKAGATLNNVTISDANTSDTYAIWIQPKGQDIVINGLVIDMIACSDGRGIKIDNQYINAADEGQVTLDIKNATFKTEEKAAILVKSTKGADITASNCNISKVAADSTNLVWVDEAVAAYANLVSVTGATGLVEGTAGVAQLNNIKYGKLADAVAAAAPAGDTITLLADCDESVTVGKELTFDFNGTNFTGFITPAAGYTYMDGVVKKAVASGTTSTGSVTSGTVTATKAKMYRLAAAGGSMTELNIKVEKIEKTTVTGKLVNDVPAYVPNIYKVNNTYYVEVAKADATYALKNNGAYVYLAPAGTTGDVNAVIAKFATAVVLDQYVAAAEDVECGDAVKGTKGAAIYKSGNDAYYADGSDWAYFKGEFVKYNKNAKVDFQPHKWDAKSIIVKSTDVKGTKVPVTIECEKCEKTFSIVPSAKFDNTWVKGVNYTTDKAVDKYNTAAVKYYIVLENATYTGTYVPSVPSTDKVQSADTFDAGIAMYVGMSVMAAAGAAVVIGKKKD